MDEPNSPPEPPEKSYRLMESRSEARIAIGEVLDLACREIRVFDADPATLKDYEIGQSARIELFRRFLLASRDHRLRIALHDTRGIESALLLASRDHSLRIALHDTRGIEIALPRLIALLTQFSGQVQIHRTVGQAAEARDAMVIVDDAHYWRKLHVDHPRSVLTLHSAGDTRPFLERFEEIWEQSELAVTGSNLGL